MRSAVLLFLLALVLSCQAFSTQPENCPKICPANYEPLCASRNGVSRLFSNECELRATNCGERNKYRLVNIGPCKVAGNDCPKVCPAIYQPVCAILNGIQREFTSECELRATACYYKQKYIIKNQGRCA